jgi:hypothetical protein
LIVEFHYAAPKGNCERPEIPNGTFVQVDGKNVTDNQIYDICTEIIYKCENPDHRLIYNSNTTENSRRFCDASTQNWTGSPPKCGKSYFLFKKKTFLPLRIVFPPFGRFYTVATCGSLHLHFQFNVTYDKTVLAEERYQNGTKAIISCPENKNNNKTMICQSNGTWLGGDVPKCCKFFFSFFSISQLANKETNCKFNRNNLLPRSACRTFGFIGNRHHCGLFSLDSDIVHGGRLSL